MKAEDWVSVALFITGSGLVKYALDLDFWHHLALIIAILLIAAGLVLDR